MTTPTLTLGTPGDIVSAIPHLLGFTPTASVVLVALKGKTVHVTTRVDSNSIGETIPQVITVFQREQVTNIIIVTYMDTLPLAQLVGHMTEGMITEAGLSLMESLSVDDSTYRSNLCDNYRCCPQEGHPIPETAVSTTLRAIMGSAPLPSRESTVNVAPDGTPMAELVTQLIPNDNPSGTDFNTRDLWMAEAASDLDLLAKRTAEAEVACRTVPADSPRRIHMLAVTCFMFIMNGSGAKANIVMDEILAMGTPLPTLADLANMYLEVSVNPVEIRQYLAGLSI